GALFLLVGFLAERHGTVSVTGFGGLQKLTPVLAGTFLVVGLSALSLPGLAPFVSEIMVLVCAFPVAPVAVIVSTLGVVFAALYILLTYQKVFTGPTPASMEGTAELTMRERIVTWPLIALMLVLGIAPGLALTYLTAPSADLARLIELVGA